MGHVPKVVGRRIRSEIVVKKYVRVVKERLIEGFNTTK